jgi:ankyrin repeat protein
MNVSLILRHLSHFSISRLAALSLIALACSAPALYCNPVVQINTDPFEFDAYSASPFFNAVRAGDLPTIKAMLQEKPDRINDRDYLGRTPLHWAAASFSKEVMRLLLAKGADANARAKDGTRPLHEAAAHGWKENAELLLENKAEINAETNGGITALKVAESRPGSKDVAELLRRLGGHSHK